METTQGPCLLAFQERDEPSRPTRLLQDHNIREQILSSAAIAKPKLAVIKINRCDSYRILQRAHRDAPAAHAHALALKTYLRT